MLLGWRSLSLSSASPLWISLGIVALYLGILLLISEGLNRFKHTDAEFTRKIFHIGSGQVILLAWWLAIPAWLIVIAAILASIIAIVSYFLPILPSINSVGRKSLGTFFYAVSIGVLVSYFFPLQHPYYAVIGVLIMAWGDGLAAIIGQRFGKHSYQIGGIKKSWEGSLAMLGASFLVTAIVLASVYGIIWQVFLISLWVAIAATGLEAFSKLGVDNLTVPLGSGMLTFYLVELLL
ncbi:MULTISPECIES: diacylglycerol/polyprenol kinase family protein [Spirulina sp. CCY15215]|uniref:diacylglycerol/polyprenol kinase family protein n=1 Tax=Spirulina sp. CCY15215 TaxID=2767591 RepID=UPI0032AEC47B